MRGFVRDGGVVFGDENIVRFNLAPICVPDYGIPHRFLSLQAASEEGEKELQGLQGVLYTLKGCRVKA
jgi:hypothetical protein